MKLLPSVQYSSVFQPKKMRVFFLVVFLGLAWAKPSLEVQGDLIKFSLYYEALCPYCSQFITEQFYPAYEKIGEYLNVELVPYGNIHQKQVNGSWVFDCQHGPDECAINKLEACGLARSKNQAKIMDYVYCIETGARKNSNNLKLLAKCATKLALTANELLKCAKGAEGDELLNELGKKQRNLNPSKQYVPWLLFNDNYDPIIEEHARENFLKTVCDLLTNKPKICSDETPISVVRLTNEN